MKLCIAGHRYRFGLLMPEPFVLSLSKHTPPFDRQGERKLNTSQGGINSFLNCRSSITD
ncbi:hypothetical protein MGMO_126c00380 [Methyloglobulus morosus KoM1]|uniref:Uncharacterized protein n=1 Tax=Methyloglobulus morosus KoM1 TaxID=1116472 RepID=V5BQ96_9GAMM|nr:hypothetical protein MGMO_126c00380 [Methyloglobulus morosus KoM1]